MFHPYFWLFFLEKNQINLEAYLYNFFKNIGNYKVEQTIGSSNN